MLPLRNLCGLMLLAVLGMAQNTTDGNTGDQTDMTDPVLEALTAEAARKKKEEEIAESEKKIRDAQPGADVKVLEGKTAVDDDVKIETQMFSYNAVQEISKQIATRVNTHINSTTGNSTAGAATIFIHDISLQSAIRAYQAFLIQKYAIQRELLRLEKNLEDKGPEKTMKSQAIPSVAGTARSVIDLLSLFRQDTEFKGRSVIVEEEALVAQVAHEINKLNQNATVVYPKLLPPGLSIIPDFESSKLIESITVLQGIQEKAARHGRELEEKNEEQVKRRTELTEQIKTLQKDVNDKRAKLSPDDPKISATIGELATAKGELAKVTNGAKTRENLKQAFADLNDLVASLLGTLLKTEQAAGSTLLGTLLTAENILEQLKKKEGYLLALKPVSAGGSYRIRRNLFTTLFTGACLSYSGGAIVSFILLDWDSRIVESRTLQYMNGFSKFKNLKKLTKGHNFHDDSK